MLCREPLSGGEQVLGKVAGLERGWFASYEYLAGLDNSCRSSSRSFFDLAFKRFAGIPQNTPQLSSGFVTKDNAPTDDPSPTLHPGRTIAPDPMITCLPIYTAANLTPKNSSGIVEFVRYSPV